MVFCLPVIGLLISMFLVVLGIRLLLVVVTIEYDSMEPTLLHGDRVLVLKHFPKRWLHRGTVVIAWPWGTPTGKGSPFGIDYPFIKRIMGMPGTKIAVDQQKNVYYENYPDDAVEVWDIPQEHYFLLGDNHSSRVDSTAWGPVHQNGILGVVIMKLPDRT